MDILSKQLSLDCYYTIANAYCYLCSSDTISYIDNTKLPTTIEICQQFCDVMKESCTIEDMSIILQSNELINKDQDYCQLFYERQGLNVSITKNFGCYSGSPIKRVIDSVEICLQPSIHQPSNANTIQMESKLIEMIIGIIILMIFI